MGLTNYPRGITSFGVPILPGPPFRAGNVFWVDSGSGVDDPSYGSYEKPFASIDYAVGKCTANNDDLIYVKAGHNESVIAAGGLDLDVAGITILFLGEGSDKAKVTFGTDVGADMDVDAASITLINPKFVAGIDALTGPIDVNSTDFTIINGEWHDAAAKAVTDCIVATSGATRLKIDGWKYYQSTTGTQKQSNIQLNGVDDAVLKNIDIRGDFATGNVENVTDEVLNVRLEDIYLDNLNSSPTPAMVIDANATGIARGVKCRVASGTTYVSSVGKINWADDCEGFSTDGYGGEPIGTAVATGLEGQIAALQADVGASADATTTDSLNGKLGTDTEMADRSLFDLLVGSGPAAYPTAAAAANDVSLAEVIRYISENQSYRLVSKTYADLTGYDTAAAFTVTGDVMVKVVGVVGSTAITSTSGTTTLSVGTTEAAAAILAAATIDNTQFAATDVWVDSSPANDCELMGSDAAAIIGGGADIILTRNVDDITAGSLTLYCWWKPLSSDGAVVAA